MLLLEDVVVVAEAVGEDEEGALGGGADELEGGQRVVGGDSLGGTLSGLKLKQQPLRKTISYLIKY